MDTLFNVAMYCYIDTMVSDIVWAQLDPHAGRLTRCARARLLVAIACGVALLAAFALASTAGLITPHVSATGTEWSGANRSMTIMLDVTNHGSAGVTVTAFGRGYPGAALTSVTPLPLRLAGGDHGHITLHYDITSCTDAPPKTARIPVRVKRFWGSENGSATDASGSDWLTEAFRLACSRS
jgi:hypothetical protein